MLAGEDSRPSDETGAAAGPTFALERFAWGGPDRLELSGTFTGLGGAPTGSPVLVLASRYAVYRLPASPDDSVPEEGAAWQATFVWQEPPGAFATAALELDRHLVELPAPGDGSEPSDPALLPVRRARPAGENLPLEEALIATTEDLRRARADLQAERDGRAADAAAFREGLAQLREAAEEALAVERNARQAEITELQDRVAELGAAAAEADRLRAETETARADVEETQRRIRVAREELEGAAQLAGRLTAGAREKRKES